MGPGVALHPEPPYFDPSMAMAPPAEFSGARALAIFDDSITTDHISPAGAIKATSPAGDYLRDRGVPAPTSTATARVEATTR